MGFLPVEVIKKKRDGVPLSDDEIRHFILGYTAGTVAEYQMSALLMAIFWRGMSDNETLSLTKCMLESGLRVDFSDLPQKKVDKHSTGGVGDKTSLLLAPIVACAGVYVPMISGRGLGHTGGTLDKLESIPGFNTQIEFPLFRTLVSKLGTALIGQTKEICPADKKIYALRDVTGTVESLPLICASIMSKKLAEGIDGLVLDVKWGTGAFMKTQVQAEALAQNLINIGKGYGKQVIALITDMNQPLGRYAGNALEVKETLDILSGKSHILPNGRDAYADTRELSLILAAEMVSIGKSLPISESRKICEEVLNDGRALIKFKDLCAAQGGDLNQLPVAKYSLEVRAEKEGYISQFLTEEIGMIGIKIKAGRAVTTDLIDPTAGVEFHAKIGDKIKSGDPIFTLYGNDRSLLEQASSLLPRCVTISLQKPSLPTLIVKRLE